MNLSSISRQLVREMKASGGKTAVLVLLLLVGLYFWVPPLLKAFSSGATAASPTSVHAKVASNDSTAATSGTSPATTESAKKSYDSKTLLRLLHEQPPLQPASAQEMPPKPCGLNDELLPLPVIIAGGNLAEPSPPTAKFIAKRNEKLDGLFLKNTLIGPSRRVAIINNQRFREGQNIAWNGRQLLLESVNRKSVTLTDGSQSWQLTLKDSLGESVD